MAAGGLGRARRGGGGPGRGWRCRWLAASPEPRVSLQAVDELLRCGICFDYFSIAMIIPQCSHNCKYGPARQCWHGCEDGAQQLAVAACGSSPPCHRAAASCPITHRAGGL